MNRSATKAVLFTGAVAFCCCSVVVNSRGQATEPVTQPSPKTSPESVNSKLAERPRYQIQLQLDVDSRSYTGSERVRWTNRGDRATSSLYFHLYSNMRSEGSTDFSCYS